MTRLFCCLLFLLTSCASTPQTSEGPVDVDSCVKTTDDLICTTRLGASQRVVVARGAGRVWVVQVDALSLKEGAAAALIERKHREDELIYNNPGHAFFEEVQDTYQGNAQTFLKDKAVEAQYAGSFWQRLSATLAQVRTAGAIDANQWLEADPLIGTAGNGPAFVFEGWPGLSGNAPGSWTSRIAAAHDADWSLGRYLNQGPLAMYLAPASVGGTAPEIYTDALGLAGLGRVTCDPTQSTSCESYEFSATGLGGPYARPLQHHPDWRIEDQTIDGIPQTVCTTVEQQTWCWCLTSDDLLSGACPAA